MKTNQIKYRSIELFAGAGGLAKGLEMAGISSVLGTDISQICGESFAENFPEIPFIADDIRNISVEQLLKMTHLQKGELDVLAGGPPCQGFSINAPIRSLNDQRNGLYREFFRLAEGLFPKIIIFENVTGIISLGKGSVVKAIYKELTGLGYAVKHKILFAAHYGVPQARYRTIFIATRLPFDIIFPEPKYDATSVANFSGADLCFKLTPLFSAGLKRHTTVWDAISDLPEINGKLIEDQDYAGPAINDYQKLMRLHSRKVKNHFSSKLADVNIQRLKHIPIGGSWRDIPFELLPKGLQRARRSDHTKRYGRLHPEGLCCTVLTKCDPHWGSFFHPYQDRIISVREAARMQSFPDDFVFKGSVTEQYEQVGNAVPPLLGREIGLQIIELLKKGA